METKQSLIKLIITYMIACSLAIILVLLFSRIEAQYNNYYFNTKLEQERLPIWKLSELNNC